MSTLQTLIAHYLATTYPVVLPTFLEAARLPPPDLINPPSPDLRTVVADHVAQSLAARTAQLKLNEPHDVLKASLDPTVHLKPLRAIPGVSADSLLSVQAANLPRRSFNTTKASYQASSEMSIIVTSVDKTLKVLNLDGGIDYMFDFKASTLCTAVHPVHHRYLAVGGMDGSTTMLDLITRQVLQTFHSRKPVTRVAFSPNGRWFATSSYDRNITLFSVLVDDVGEVFDETDDPALGCDPGLHCEELRRIKVDSNPEALLLTDQWAIFSLRESYALHYVNLETQERKLKSFNVHAMDNHVSFAVLDLAIYESIIACLTGDRGAERILLYSLDPDEGERLACLWTSTESDPYFLPRMTWLPDGTGFITTTPTGHLNLVSLTGEVRSSLKLHGSPGSSEIVRDVCTFPVEGSWQVVSVGYDKMVRFAGP